MSTNLWYGSLTDAYRQPKSPENRLLSCPCVMMSNPVVFGGLVGVSRDRRTLTGDGSRVLEVELPVGIIVGQRVICEGSVI